MKRTCLAIALLFAACLEGCDLTSTVVYETCAEQCSRELDPDACIARCGTCPGQCVNPTPEGFDGPALLWVGRTVDEPQCPESAPTTVYTGYETPDYPIECSRCLCGEPACTLPDELRAATSMRCDGSMPVPLDARDILNGACVPANEALVSDRKSLLLGSPTVTPCEPMIELAPVPRLLLYSRWYRSGKACAGVAREGVCASPSKTCVPAEQMRDFSQCIMHVGEGEVTCPQDYPEQVVLYDGMKDERRCTPCECGPPTGSECSLMLLSYRDGACSDLLTAGVSSKDPGCIAPTPGVQPKSMKAVWHVNEPGSCEPSGGELKGEIVLTGPSTFCCQTRPGRNSY